MVKIFSDFGRKVKHYVRAGTDRLGKGGSTRRIKRIYYYNNSIYYPNPNVQLHYYDIALFEVNPPFRFSKTIQPAKLPEEISDPPDKLYVYGWGQTETGFRNNLMGTDVSYVPYEDCRYIADYFDLISKEHHLCYGDLGKDACYGDSGGPLVDSNGIITSVRSGGKTERSNERRCLAAVAGMAGRAKDPKEAKDVKDNRITRTRQATGFRRS
ncbi:trypsin-7-like [Ceratina calcarata]|uniref:Trypsin-7-like n=1 Tax=Ceratina calcarata TaxID=156304 RepID=A0AAJ7NFX3_9HYME|nr:trypsin-7-like [Ceratina calcarata]